MRWPAVVALSIATAGCQTDSAAEPPPHGPPLSCSVTLAQYTQLQTQMTYDEVLGILGCSGNELSSNDTTIIFQWKGAGSKGANMNAMFQGGRLINKAQSGLQ